MPTYLVPEDTAYRPVLMDRAIIFFGRHPDCDVIITCSRKVSRKHCCVAQIDDYFVVRDLGSMNGVWVNGKAAGREQRLAVGDTLHVGDVPFNVEMGHYELPKGKLVIGPKPEAEPPRKPPRKKQPQPRSDDVLPVPVPVPNGEGSGEGSGEEFDDFLDGLAPEDQAASAPPAAMGESGIDLDGDAPATFSLGEGDMPSRESMEMLLDDDSVLSLSDRPAGRNGGQPGAKGSRTKRPGGGTHIERPMTALPIDPEDELEGGFEVADEDSIVEIDEFDLIVDED